MNKLVLSVFCGIDLFGKAFEQTGFCVVRSPDKNIDGGDIRDFHPPSGCFGGVIGGSPCQDFSQLNRHPKTYSHEMLNEFVRVVEEASPDWFLFENVVGFPNFEISGYTQQRFPLDLAWFTPFSRRRDFMFGSKSGQLLNPIIRTNGETQGGAVICNDKRSFRTCCDIQGLPSDFDLPFFTLPAKKQAVANGVPMAMGLYLSNLIHETLYGVSGVKPPTPDYRRCACGCGRVVTGRALTASATCRKRKQRQGVRS